MTTAAFLGLGAMGAPMAARLTGPESAATTTLVWNRSFDKAEAHARAFGSVAATLEGVAGADFIFSCLPTSDEVDELMGKLLPHLKRGTVWVDCTSGRPAAARAQAERLREQGVDFLDAPVSGGPGGAAAGTLAVMVGGEQAVLERARPLIESFGGTVLRVGAVGSGFAVKAVNNALMAVNLWAAGEGLASLALQGVELRAALKVINAGSGRSFASESKLEQQVFSREFTPSFKLGLLAKDAGIALEDVQAVKGAAPLLAQVAMLLRAAQHTLGPDVDHTALVQLIERQNGVELK